MKLSSALLHPLVAGLVLATTACHRSEQRDTGQTPAISNGAAGPSASAVKKKKIAYVTNGVDPFWNTAAAGVRAAEKAFDIECEVLMPPKGIVDQKRMLEGLLARGIDGIAISPIDAKNQVALINEAAARCPVITHDSDAPDSKRLCFVGMDNYKAGRAAGKLVKEALPAGGKVMLFVGRLEQLNAQQRRQGVIDELMNSPLQAPATIQYSPPGQVVSSPKSRYVVLDTRTDNFDYARAKANAQDAMASVPDLACMVGLFAYNSPHCLEAAKEAARKATAPFRHDPAACDLIVCWEHNWPECPLEVIELRSVVDRLKRTAPRLAASGQEDVPAGTQS